MSVSVLNTDAGLSGKTLLNAESTQTITGSKTFDVDPSAPFAVTSGSAVVANLDADKLDGLEATAFIKADGTVALTGTLTLTSGLIAFPAVQIPSTNANTLDDYEEGTWTPVLGGSGGTSGQTYTTQYGRYIKIGKKVDAWFDITLSAKGTITTNCQIQGLPFVSDSGGSVPYIGCVQWVTLASNWVSVVTALAPGASVASIQGAGAAAAANNTALTTTDIQNTTTMRGCISYVASA